MSVSSHLRVTIVGGGSAQWVPTLIEDFANTECLSSMTLVLEDLDEHRLEPTGAYARKVSQQRHLGWDVITTVKLDQALEGADFVVVCISTGGLDAMSVDLELSQRFGLPMPIGDTVGPAGISRSLRNVPVFLRLAAEIERRCPEAWLLNLSNPLTTICRSVSLHSSVRVLGLCHEMTNTMFFLSQLLDCDFFDLDPTVVGVNHLPLITGLRVAGQDASQRIAALARGEVELDAPLPLMDRVMARPRPGPGGSPRQAGSSAAGWTKGALLDSQALNWEIARQMGALPGADSDHTSEFFPWFITEESGWGRSWGIEMVSIGERRQREARYQAALAELLHPDSPIPRRRSPELVAPLIEALCGGNTVVLPLNLPNDGACPQLPPGAVVETMCSVDASGVRPRGRALAPSLLAEWLRRIICSQELTIQSAISADPGLLLQALACDPFTSRLGYGRLVKLRDELLGAALPWLGG